MRTCEVGKRYDQGDKRIERERGGKEKRDRRTTKKAQKIERE